MPRTKAQFDEMRQATKERIQNAASRLFAQKGISGTNVQEIADYAGISIGLLYRHYKTKDELFNELVDMARCDLSKVTELFASDDNPKNILTAITTEIVEDYKTHDEFVDYLTFLTQALISGLQSKALEELIDEDKRLIDAFEKLIIRGQNDGIFRSGNPKEIACTYMSTLQGIGIFRNVMKSHFVVPSVDTLLSFILK